jgi:secondary thiamine-phosphate synthase enzyme
MPRHPLITQSLTTRSRCEIIDLTARVRQIVRDHQVRDGIAVVYVPHTTAGVTINENADPDVKHDMLRKLGELVPLRERYYQHGEGNSDSHVKTAMVGNSATLIIEGGELVLGTWQGIYFCEFDGPRTRQFMVKLIESAE